MKLKQFIFAFMAMLLCFTVSVNAQVAKVGNTEYATIDDAGTVTTELKVATLAELKDALASTANVPVIITTQIVIPKGETVELDLNGKTVNSVFNGTSTTNHIYALSNEGTLTIKGNGSINSRGIYNYGSLTLNAGAINAIDGNGGYAVNNQSGSTFVMNGGVVAATNEDDHQSSSGGYDATALKVPAGCTATLNGGTINNVCDFTYAIDAAGTLNIPATSTITVNGTHGAIAVSGGVTTIDAGTFQIPADNYSRTDNVLYVSGGSLVVNGGTFIGDSDTAGGGSCLYDAAGTAVVNGGTFKGSSGGDVWGTTGTTIKGGTFENLTEKQHIADGYEMNENGEVVEAVKEVKVATLAELQAALADNSNELPIIITETIVIPEGETVVLDLNGKTVTRQDEANQYALRNLGDLTIKDTKGNGSINARGIYNGYGDGAANVATAKITVLSGTINAKGTNGGAAIFNYGVADIQGGNFTSIGGYSLNNQTGASMTITDGVTAKNGIYVSGATLVVDGGEISGNRSGCHVLYAWNSTVTINGGEFYNNNSGNSTTMAAGTTELTINGGTFGIKDGRVPGNGNTWTSCLTDTQNSATMTVNGGTFNGGFRVQAGTTMTIAGGEFNDCYGSGYNIYGTAIVKGGTFTDDAAQKFATKNLAAGYELGADGTVKEVTPAAVIGTQKFATLQAAIEAVQEGETIVVLDNITFTTGANGSTNGISYTRGASFTLDLNGKTITSNLGNNALRFKIGDGNTVKDTEVTVLIKNGKIVSGSNNWCAISAATADNSGNKLILNLTDLTIEANKAGDFAVKSWAGAVVNTNNVDVTSNYAGGFYAVGGEIVLDENSSVAQKGLHTAPYMSYAFGVSSGTGKMTINGGIYSAVPAAASDAYNQGASHGSSVGGVMSSGGTLIINGGTFSNDNFGDAAPTAPRSLIMADAGAKVEINGGTFNAMAKIVDPTNNAGGANAEVTISGGTFSANPTDAPYNLVKLAEDYIAVENNGVWNVVKAAAKIGTMAYATLDEAVQAAKVGDKITLLNDADLAFAHNPQYNNVYASEIDLNGKTMTIKKGDVRFDNVTIKNGNIIVQPGTYNGTAIFLMYSKNLTFDGVKVTATGVAAPAYLIGLEGTSNLNLMNGSEIVINNESLVNIGSIIADNGKGNTVTIKDSKIDIKNSNARLYLGGTNGNITVENSDIDLNGVKEGFYLRAGQTLAITGNSTVDITLITNEGRYGINLTDITATYTKAETATVNATVYEPKVAKVGENTYKTLAQAVAAVEDGGTITLIANETFTKNNRYNNGGWWDGLGYSGDKSFTIDLAGFTISQDGALNDYLMWFKNDGAKANTITLKNGTLDAGTTAYCALATASSNAKKITVNLENIQLINNNSSGATLKIRGGAELNANAGTIITGKNSYLGIEAVGAKTVVNIYEGAEIYQNGTSSYCGCLAGASGNSTINVYGGKGQSKSGGFIAMTSGGTINVEGGEWIANTDGTYANSNKSVLIAQSDKQYNAGAGNAVVNVTGGTFKGGYNCYGNKVGDAQINIKGGNFNAEPTSYVAEGYFVVENNGVWTVERGLAGAGTEAEPYLINNVSDLKFFRDEVNKGVANKYNDPGVWVALGADIDLSGENWVGIGSATADHGFMGNFDGKTFKIKNLTITDPAVDTDGYAYAGLFGVTEGTDKDNQNTIKNLTIENVTITTTGHIAAAAVAYPYYTIIDNVKVCGDIKIKGGNYTAGVLAYTRRCVNASNLSIVGNDGSFVEGSQTVGGVISDIQMNGGLTADYKIFSAEGLTIRGEKSVGGISGIIATQTLVGATVKNVALESQDNMAGVVAGRLGGTSTISNVTYENVTGATALIGASYDGAKAVAAKIGDTYFATLEAAYKAAQEGATVELLAPVVIASGETLTLDKNVTVVYTSNVAGEDMFTNRGTLNISAGTITYANTDATASNVTVSTISTEPGSVLNITGGTVENKTVKADGSSIYSFAIDMLTNGNLGDVTATISGGKVYSDYMAIRQFNNGTACKNSLTISNGYIYGAKRAVQIHMDNNAAVTAISGGKIEAGKDGYALCNFAKTSALSVTDGEFIGAVYSASEKFISGGIYNNPVEAAYCKEGYMPNVIADGKYGVTAVANLVASFNGLGYATLAEAIAASTPETGWGGEVTLLKDVTLKGGYADAGEGLRIEKSVTINGAGYTIDCGKFTKGIRIYQNGDLASNVMFKHTNIVNNNYQGRCIDTRSGKINLMLNDGVNLTAHGTNSQPLTIGGSEAMTKVTISGGTIDAGTSGYGVICFVPVTNHINVQGNAVIKGLAAFYLKEGVTETAIKLSQSTSIGTNKYASASGVFGAVVIEGSNNTVRLEHNQAVVKAVAGDGAEMATQAAFLVRGEGNTINILAENAQVITEGKNAYRAIVNTDVAASAKMIEKGNELKLVAENRGYQFYSFEEAVRFAGNEGTIKVVNDFELAEVWTVAEGQNITLDLNGKTLSTAYVAGSTTNHIYAIHNYGELTITDSSDAKTGKISARGIFNYGNMTLTSGTINAIDGNGGYGVRNYAGATFTMNGGTIATTYEDGDVPGEGYDASPVRVDEGATFTMNDGVINNVSNYTVAIDNYGTTIINGGKATTIHTTLANSGTMIIEGGEFTCNGLEGITAHALWAADGTTTINGGTFNGKDNYNGFNVDASEGAVVTITGGTFLPVHSGSLYGDGTITVSGGTFFDKISDQRCELGFQAVANEYGTYTVKETGCRNAMTIVDGEVTEFVNEKEITVGTLTYTRGKIKGTWTPFYVPFAVPVSALADKFDVAYINDVRRTDSDNDGELDKFSMEVILIHCESKNVNGSSKTLKANYPYFIRSKSGQEVTMEIALTDAKLYAAKENVFDCTTMTEKFEIKGNYNQIPSDKFGENDYVVGGGVWGNITPGYPLNPFRFYMTRSSRDGSDPTTMAPMKSMKIVVCGEEDENGATIIYDIVEDNLNNNGNDYIYDLQGRRVSEPKKGGIYIKNGKKILY